MREAVLAQKPRRKPAGGFSFISVRELMLAWSCYRDGLITLRDLRVWLSLYEVLSRRCQVESEREPTYTAREVAALIGSSEKSARAGISSLNRVGLARVTETSISFAAGDDELRTPLPASFEKSLTMITNRNRRVPVPRRIIRFLARSGNKVLIATVIGHLIRCLYYRKAEIAARGTCKASWIADVFGVDSRNVKRARKELVSIGWLKAAHAPQWHRNRFGWSGEVNLDWKWLVDNSTGETGDSPPPQPQIGRKLPLPIRNRKLLTEYMNQKPATRGRDGCLKNSFRQKQLKAPDLRNVILEDLRETKRTLELFQQAVAAGLVGEGEASRLQFVAASEHARGIGRTNPCGLFVTVVRKGLWSFITQQDEDRARTRLRRSEPGRRPIVNRGEHSSPMMNTAKLVEGLMKELENCNLPRSENGGNHERAKSHSVCL